MSDFLDNLVARSLSSMEVVLPRPLSRFEPLHSIGGPVSGYAVGLETVKGEQASTEIMFDAPSPARLPARHPVGTPAPGPVYVPGTPGSHLRLPTGQEPTPVAPQTTETVPEPPSNQLARGPLSPQMPAPTLQPAAAQPSTTKVSGESNPDRPALIPAATRDKTDDAPPVLEPAIQHIGIEQGATPQERQPATSATDTSGTQLRSAAEGQRRPQFEPAIRQTVIQRIISPAAPAATSVAGAKTEVAPLRRTAERESRTGLEPAIPRPDSPPMETTLPSTRAVVIAEPHVTRYVEPATRVPADLAATPEPAPTIHVTIGRVEVRATPPAAPTPKKQRPQPPVMSLDEYLRQRAGGGGR